MATTIPRVIAVSAMGMDPRRPRISNVDIGARQQGLLLTYSPTDSLISISPPDFCSFPVLLDTRRGPISTHHSHEPKPNPNCTAVTLARLARPRYHFFADRPSFRCALLGNAGHSQPPKRILNQGCGNQEGSKVSSSGWRGSENAIVHALVHLNTTPSLHLGLRPNLAPDTPIHLVVVLLLLTQH